MVDLLSRCFFLFLLIVGCSAVLYQGALAQNPFLAKPSKEVPQTGQPMPSREKAPSGNYLVPKDTKPTRSWISYPLLNKIIVLQAKLNQKISKLAREAKRTKSVKPLLPLIALTFLYGVLHAAGPGHGKAVAGSYVLTQRQGLGRILVLGNLIALFHGLSGMLLVLVARFFLETGVPGSVERTTYITQLTSYGVLTLLGLGLIASAVITRVRPRASEENTWESKENVPLSSFLSWKKLFSVAFFMGMIPCPGVVLVMIFCISLGMPWLGGVLSLAHILGMALTISSVVLIGSLGKTGLAKASGRYVSTEKVLFFVEFAGAFLLTGFGALFFLATLST